MGPRPRIQPRVALTGRRCPGTWDGFQQLLSSPQRPPVSSDATGGGPGINASEHCLTWQAEVGRGAGQARMLPRGPLPPGLTVPDVDALGTWPVFVPCTPAGPPAFSPGYLRCWGDYYLPVRSLGEGGMGRARDSSSEMLPAPAAGPRGPEHPGPTRRHPASSPDPLSKHRRMAGARAAGQAGLLPAAPSASRPLALA